MTLINTNIFTGTIDHLEAGEPLKGITKLTYSELVSDYIKQSLLEGELSPGDQVKEVLLAKKLGISRAPIREALQMLTREGLIQSEPQKGKYVSALTSKQIINSYFTGGVLEAAAVTEALDLYTPHDIDKLEEIIQKMRQVAETGESLDSLTKLDSTFHSVLFSRIDNDLLLDLCRHSCQGISKFLLYKYWIKLFSPQQVYERHLAILDALKSGDGPILEKTIRKHYADSGKRMAKFGVDVHKTDEPVASNIPFKRSSGI